MRIFLGFLLASSFLFISCKKEYITNVSGSGLTPPVAHAGNNQINISPGSTTVQGSGTSSNGRINGYLWSLISGPNVPEIVSPSSATTVIRNLVNGNYLFQFAVIDSAGLTGIDSLAISVRGPVTLTLQPSNSPTELTMIYWTSIGSDPASPELIAEAWTNQGSPFTVRSIFKFDLSSIPSSANIVSARLSLYSDPNPTNGNQSTANAGSANTMLIQRVTSGWTSSTTWPNQPSSDAATQLVIPHTNSGFLDLIDLDVTSLVSPMVSGSNYGFIIKLQNEVIYNSRIFCSSYHSNAAKHPKLVITYN